MSDDVTAADDRLTEAEREVLLVPCGCGHSINDHGDLAGCWDEEPAPCDCARPFTDLLAERVARIVADRLAAVEAERARLAAAVERVRKALDEMATWCGPYGHQGVAHFIDRRDQHIRAALDGGTDR